MDLLFRGGANEINTAIIAAAFALGRELPEIAVQRESGDKLLRYRPERGIALDRYEKIQLNSTWYPISLTNPLSHRDIFRKYTPVKKSRTDASHDDKIRIDECMRAIGEFRKRFEKSADWQLFRNEMRLLADSAQMKSAIVNTVLCASLATQTALFAPLFVCGNCSGILQLSNSLEDFFALAPDRMRYARLFGSDAAKKRQLIASANQAFFLMSAGGFATCA
ncbi:MAG: hypothetical protein M0R33_15510 [Methylomonas sp.]|jgi:hypothetical protein|uniref:hypothetical protein n=1 Tax=Methylomonas sp. TaxID=418 RepID=UPI0025DA8B4C|nr:hypothetical protein [Methylomonas sp.]MCK9607850.1 hypothetical protein [Methylomonas sp.]